MQFIDSTKFRGVIKSQINCVAVPHKELPWRDTLEEVRADLYKATIMEHGKPKVINRNNYCGYLDYIENERGVLAIPSKVLPPEEDDRH